jgi:hypothetical protein
LGRREIRDVRAAEALYGAAEGSYAQAAAVVEEDEELDKSGRRQLLGENHVFKTKSSAY